MRDEEPSGKELSSIRRGQAPLERTFCEEKNQHFQENDSLRRRLLKMTNEGGGGGGE